MQEQRPRVAIMMGDPSGIGAEIIAKALASGSVYPQCLPVVVGSAPAMERATKTMGVGLRVRKVETIADTGEDPGTIDVLDMGNLKPEEITIGTATAAGGRAVRDWRAEVDRLLDEGAVQAVVSGPVNSDAMKLAGVHMEAEEGQLGIFNFQGPLRILQFTPHIPLREVTDWIKKDALLGAFELVHDTFKRWGIPNARLGIAGLNPHAVGDEETNEIKPAIAEAQSRGINAIGPVPPDAIFRQCTEGKYDMVVAMYHDQGNIAQKLWSFPGAVAVPRFIEPRIDLNVTHGTAYDIAGKGIVSEASMLHALEAAAGFAAGKGFPKH